MLEELDFKDLEGASIAKKRRAISLAYRRYSWYKDQKHLKKCAVVLHISYRDSVSGAHCFTWLGLSNPGCYIHYGDNKLLIALR